MEKAAALADSRLFLPASTRDACVQEQAVLLLPTTQQSTKNKQLPDNNYLLRLQLLTATSTAHGNFNCLLQLQPPTATSTAYCNFNYLLQLQLPTATSTAYCNFNYLLQLQLPTATSTTYCNNTHLLQLLQPIGTTVFISRTATTQHQS
jgi:hypothetical protein